MTYGGEGAGWYACSPETRVERDPDRKIEREPKPRDIVVATTTFYPSWHPGAEKSHYHPDKEKVDKVRGDLALKMIAAALEKGYRVVVVDGANNIEFKNAVAALGAVIENQVEKGMSGSRRQVFRLASSFTDARVICWTEPEKVSFVTERGLWEAALPVLRDEADVSVPQRDFVDFLTYPDYQAVFEMSANFPWNELLRQFELLPDDVAFLDAYFGPRIIKNDPELLAIFHRVYAFKEELLEGAGVEWQKLHDTELWANATFLSLVNALVEGYRVVSVPVPKYIHPPEQTAIEQDSPEFVKKRRLQKYNILLATLHLLRMVKPSSPRAKHESSLRLVT